MKKNMGTIDRIIRIVIAGTIAALYFAGSIGGTLGIILLALAAVLALTSAMSSCPLYLPFGIDSSKCCGGKGGDCCKKE